MRIRIQEEKIRYERNFLLYKVYMENISNFSQY